MRKKRAVYYTECPKCGKQIGTGALTRHIRVCEKLQEQASRGKAKPGRPGHRGGNQYTKAKELGLPAPTNPNIGKPGGFLGHRHTEVARAKLSEAAKRNCFGGHVSKQRLVYNGVQLHSSYETTVAKSLDEAKVKWTRPEPLRWVDSKGKDHRYYPDFYLPAYDIYLDPKNDFLIEHTNPAFGISDREKIQIVALQNNVRVFILNKDQLTWKYIASLV